MNNSDFMAYLAAPCQGQIHLVSINPDGSSEGRDFGTDVSRATRWAETHWNEGKYVFWTINKVRPGCNKRPSVSDIVEVRFIHFLACRRQAEEQAQVIQRVTAPKPPTAIIVQGAGVNILWRVADTTLAAACSANEAFERKYGGMPGSHALNHLCPLPGYRSHGGAA